MPWSFSIKLHSEIQVCSRLGLDPLDMPRTPYRASEGKRSQLPTMPYHTTLPSSSVHHSSHQLTKSSSETLLYVTFRHKTSFK